MTIEPKKPRKPRPKMGRYVETPLIEVGAASIVEMGFTLTEARTAMMMFAASHIDEVKATLKQAINMHEPPDDSGTRH